MTHVFLGVIVIGLILAGKIVMESLKVVEEIEAEIGKFRAATQKCLSETEIELKNIAELEVRVSELKAAYSEVEQKEKKLSDQIEGLRDALDGGNQFRIDL